MAFPQVICFGEILWDLLLTGKVAGGAPMNVAFHLNQLGVPSSMISRVGNDEDGREILDFLQGKQVSADFVQLDNDHPTGTVKVTLNDDGHPQYDIVQNVAWDFIATTPVAIDAVRQTRAFVFGSLVARIPTSQNTLFEMIENAPFRVFDVNLRKPFFSKELIFGLLPKANMVKMNDEELEIIASWFGFNGTENEKMIQVKKACKIDVLLVTRGENGAISLTGTGFCSHEGYRVHVKDTIGSGDAFLAGYLSQYLHQASPEKCIDFACKTGAYVATKRGGTPVHDTCEITNLSQKAIKINI